MPTDYADYGLKIAEAFQKYLQTGDNSLIEQYSAKQLRTAVSRLSPYYSANRQWYREIENRINELSSIEDRRWQAFHYFRQKWADKVVAFGLGTAFGLFLI